jgi:hypothetical protein
MEIIKPGILPPSVSEIFRGECPNCHAQVKCSPTDHEVLPYSRSNPKVRVNCPTLGCFHVITLTEYLGHDIPDTVKP